MKKCPLCGSSNIKDSLKGPDKRIFYLCGVCCLITADKSHRLGREEEKKRYLSHNNGIEHKGYVDFLNRVINPAMRYIKPGMKGLDYGCGPSPTISVLLEKKGLYCENYDPIFFPKGIKKSRYDFIFSTECFEHFFSPYREIKRLISHIKKGGFLAVMTELWENPSNFGRWYYARDNTHVSFYHADTMRWIESHFGLYPAYNDNKRVFIYKA